MSHPQPVPISTPSGHSPEGCHILLELSGCPAPLLDDVAAVERELVQAAREAGARVVNAVFHAFAPQGISGVVVIAESHVTIHTWPEHGYAAIDIFTCGEPDLARRIQVLVERAFTPAHVNAREITRRPQPDS